MKVRDLIDWLTTLPSESLDYDVILIEQNINDLSGHHHNVFGAMCNHDDKKAIICFLNHNKPNKDDNK